jgi:hypothetical protein
MSSADDKPPKVDHRAHLIRIGLEIAHIAAIVGAGVALLKTGVSAISVAAITVAIVLTVVVMRTPRPPLPGDPFS